MERIRSGERVEHYETVRRRKDGSSIEISLTVSPIRNAHGKIIGASKIAHDISERKRAEEASRRAEQEFRDFVENASVGMHWVGPDGIILWANRTEMEMLGFTREEYIGHHIAEFHVDKPLIEDILQRLTNGETMHNYEARLRCKDGSIRHVLINSNVLWEGDKFVHTRCFTRDITERKQSEAQIAILGSRGRAPRQEHVGNRAGDGASYAVRHGRGSQTGNRGTHPGARKRPYAVRAIAMDRSRATQSGHARTFALLPRRRDARSD